MLFASELSVIVIVPHSSHIKNGSSFLFNSYIFSPLLPIDQFCPMVKWCGLSSNSHCEMWMMQAMVERLFKAMPVLKLMH